MCHCQAVRVVTPTVPVRSSGSSPAELMRGLGTARLLVSALQFEARLAWIVSFGDAVQDCTNRFVSVIVGPSR